MRGAKRYVEAMKKETLRLLRNDEDSGLVTFDATTIAQRITAATPWPDSQ